jgi:two-component system sensor histidine kinase YesM
MLLTNGGSVISATDKVLLGENVSQQDFFRLLGGGQGCFVSGGSFYCYYSLDKPGWYMVSIIPAAVLNEPFSTINFAYGICLLLLLLFAFVFRYDQNRTVIRPIEKLCEEAARLREGGEASFELRDSPDEIYALNNALIAMSKNIRRLVENEYALKLKQKEIEIACMEAQINPHFLYNTLDSIRWLAVLNGQGEIAEQIETLTNLFRHILNHGSQTTTVEQEVEHVRNYLKILNFRFGERLKYQLDVQPEALPCEVPHLILQPIVENAVIHGLSPQARGGHVLVTVGNDGETIRYIVQDDGVGTNPIQITGMIHNSQAAGFESVQSEQGFALKNIQDRVSMKYGKDYGLIFSSMPGGGTTVTVTLPALMPARGD